MAAPLLLLLVGVGALLPSSEAQRNAYAQLSPSLKRGVDLALEKIHSHAAIQQHFVFLRSLSTSDIQVGSTSSRFSAGLIVAYRAVVFLAGGVRRGVRVPPLLPQGHHLSQRDGGCLWVPPQERQGERVSFCRHVWTGFLLELVLLCLCINAAFDRLRHLLQNTARGDRAAAQTLRPLHPQNGADAGRSPLVTSDSRCPSFICVQKLSVWFYSCSRGSRLLTFSCRRWRSQTTFCSLWLAGNEGGQSGPLQPAELQQRRPNAALINTA